MQSNCGRGAEMTNPWLVVVAFCFHSFWNQFIGMELSGVTDLAMATFRVDDASVDMVYSVSILSSVPAFVLCMLFSKHYYWSTLVVCVVCTVAAGWLRYIAVCQESFKLAVISSALLGPGNAAVFVAFADLAVMLFPLGLSRNIATGLIVQIPYVGWISGSFLTAALVRSQSDLATFCLVQALLTSISLPVILAWHQLPRDPVARRSSLGGADRRSSLGGADMYGAVGISRKGSDMGKLDIDSLGSMLVNRRFLLQALGLTLLEAVSFLLPELQVWFFANQGYNHVECATNGAVYVLSGAALGMVLTGPYAVDDPHSKSAHRLVLVLFWSAAVTLGVLHLSVHHFAHVLGVLGHQGVRIFFYLLLGVNGSVSIGMLNVALPLVCAEAHPVAETYSGGMIQLAAALVSVLLNQCSARLNADMQLSLCALAALAAAVLMTAGLRPSQEDPWPTEEDLPPQAMSG